MDAESKNKSAKCTEERFASEKYVHFKNKFSDDEKF